MRDGEAEVAEIIRDFKQSWEAKDIDALIGLLAPARRRHRHVFAFDIAGDRINHIWAVRNPEKLRLWTAG